MWRSGLLLSQGVIVIDSDFQTDRRLLPGGCTGQPGFSAAILGKRSNLTPSPVPEACSLQSPQMQCESLTRPWCISILDTDPRHYFKAMSGFSKTISCVFFRNKTSPQVIDFKDYGITFIFSWERSWLRKMLLHVPGSHRSTSLAKTRSWGTKGVLENIRSSKSFSDFFGKSIDEGNYECSL